MNESGLPQAIERIHDAALSSDPDGLPTQIPGIVRGCLGNAFVALFHQRGGVWYLRSAEGSPDILVDRFRGVSLEDLRTRLRAEQSFPAWNELRLETMDGQDSLIVVGWTGDDQQRPLLGALLATVRLAWGHLGQARERQRRGEGSQLLDLGTAVVDGADIPSLFRKTVDAARIVVKASHVLLLMPGEGADTALTVRASSPAPARSLDPSVEAKAFDLGQRALRQRATVLDSGDASLLAVPLSGMSRPFGCLVAVRENEAGTPPRTFVEWDLFRFRACANYLAMALQSAATLTEQQRGVRELMLLNAVARDCARLGLDSLIPAVSERLCRSLPIDAAGTFFLDQERQELVWAGGFSNAGELSPTPARFHAASGLIMRTLTAREARRSTAADPMTAELQRFVRGDGTVRFGAIPLLVKDRAVGVVVVAARDRDLSDEEMRLLQAIGAEMAVALDNSLLFAEAHRRANDLALVKDMAEVMARSLDPGQIVRETAGRLRRALDADGISIYARRNRGFLALWREGMVPPRDSGFVPESDPILSPVLAATEPAEFATAEMEGESRAVLDATGIARGVMVPMLVADERAGQGRVSHMGGIFLSRRAARPFDSSERRILSAVAAQLALTLKNAQLYEQTRQRAEDLALVAEAGRAIQEGAQLDQALNGVVGRLAQQLNVRGCVIMLVDAAKHEIHAVAGYPRIEGREIVRVSLDADAIAARAVRERTPQVTRNLRIPPAWAHLVEDNEPRWATALPMIFGEQVLGALILVDSDPELDLGERDLDRARSMAAQIAAIIERGQLHSRLQKSLGDLAQAQAQLVRRERLAALGELAALVAHEVRNPLGVIVSSLGTLTKIVDLDGDAQRICQIMVQEAGRLDRIVSDMLDYTRPTELSLAPGSLGRALRDAFTSATYSERARGTPVDAVQTSVDIPTDLPAVPMDDRLLHQALVNLLSNAYQSLPKEGGRIDLSASLSDDRRYAEIRIDDNGPGMLPEIKSRLFEPFFTTKAKGSGLGLAMVKRIVDGHAGEIAVDTGAGRGTRFVVRLPLRSSAHGGYPQVRG